MKFGPVSELYLGEISVLWQLSATATWIVSKMGYCNNTLVN